MAVLENAVGLHRDFAEEALHFGLAPSARDAAHRVDDRGTGGVNETCFDQRQNREDRCSGVAARHCNQARFRDGVGVELCKAVDRFFEEIRVCVGETIVLLEDRAIGQPKRGRKIEDDDAGIDESARDFMRQLVWSREKDRVERE